MRRLFDTSTLRGRKNILYALLVLAIIGACANTVYMWIAHPQYMYGNTPTAFLLPMLVALAVSIVVGLGLIFLAAALIVTLWEVAVSGIRSWLRTAPDQLPGYEPRFVDQSSAITSGEDREVYGPSRSVSRDLDWEDE